jgi:hypothetical protein
MTLIPIDERDGKHCYFCGADKSVKYAIDVYDQISNKKMHTVYSCNKCILTYNDLIRTWGDNK